MNKTVIIVGSGKLASSIIKGLPKYLPHCKLDTWENRGIHPESEMVITHIGSGRQLDEVIEFCSDSRIPLIQGSTGMDIKQKNFDFTFIDSPNLNILMLKFMLMIKEHGSLFKDYDISITESHQQSKKTVPGTAIEIADALEIDSRDIKSIRDENEQENLYGISREFLPLHAYHNISIGNEDTTLNFQTLARGHESYISGLSEIIKSLDMLEGRYYHILELLELKII